MGPPESMLISASVIWFSRRRQKPGCCALHFINHIFMWTRSGHLTAQTWAFAVARGFRRVYSPARLSEESSSTLLITFDYFHLPGSVWLARTAGGLISYTSWYLCRTALCSELAPRYCPYSVKSSAALMQLPLNWPLLPFLLINHTDIIPIRSVLPKEPPTLTPEYFLGYLERMKSIFLLWFVNIIFSNE